MKKIILFLSLLVIVLAGCGSNETSNEPAGNKAPSGNAQGQEAEKESEEKSEEKSEDEAEGYVFKVNGVEIAMHAEAEPILDQLGGSKDYFESEACAFPGLEKVYTFNGFDLYTYEQDGVDYIASVVFTDDTVSTPEGLALFATKDDMISTYGDKFEQKFDSYTYLINRAQLIFIVENDEVASIEYLGTVE